MSKKVYICGPMAGKPNLNLEAFESAAAVVKERGDEPVIPHGIPPYKHKGFCSTVYGYTIDGKRHEGGCYLRGDVAVMVMCDSIYRLRGWGASKGASIESDIASILGIPIEDELS